MYNYHTDGSVPDQQDSHVLVFGANLAGRHGCGAARLAYDQYGACYGLGQGFYGNSYAIPTKDANLNVCSLDLVRHYVDEFKTFAESHPEYQFWVTRVGCGLAGYTNDQIAPMFAGSPSNCDFPVEWVRYLT